MSPCRYEPAAACHGCGSLGIAACSTTCPGPVDLDPKHHTRKEAKPMPVDRTHERPEPETTGEKCDRCKRRRRGKLEKAGGWDGRVCKSCGNTIRKCVKQGRPVPPFTGATWAKPKLGPKNATTTVISKPSRNEPAVAFTVEHRGPGKAAKTPGGGKEPRREPIAPPRPAPAPAAGLTLTFRLTLAPGLSVAALAEILRDLPAGAELVW